ncbi:MAG: DinB family protein [Acidobacteriota bacterium]|nr:DinB family protein [Acidobacteriota bacterium]
MDTSQYFLDQARWYFASSYLPKIESCLAQLTDEDVWRRANEASNSIGNLILHLSGNVQQWIVGGVGNLPYTRDREHEFGERGGFTRADLLARLKETLAKADQVLAEVNPNSLLERKEIQGCDVTVMEAILRIVQHFALHTGQIMLLTKQRTGESLKLS